MTAFDEALVSVILADYIGIDGGGKINVIGLGFQFIGLQANGATPPIFVGAVAEFPKRFAGQQVSVTLELMDATDKRAFTAAGPSGQMEAVRVQQMVPLNAGALAIPGFQAPEDTPVRAQIVMGLPGGLPLTPGHQYEWRVSIDEQRRKGWVARFDVLRPVPPPLIGGVGGPSDIPSIASFDTVVDDDTVDDND